MLNYKLVVERTLHIETPHGLALLSVGDEVFLKLHGYGWLFGTIIAYRWITDVRDTAPDGETWNKVGDVEQAAKENQLGDCESRRRKRSRSINRSRADAKQKERHKKSSPRQTDVEHI